MFMALCCLQGELQVSLVISGLAKSKQNPEMNEAEPICALMKIEMYTAYTQFNICQ